MSNLIKYPKIKLGTAPDSWGVWFPDDPNQVTWTRFLDELVQAGYSWFELGPHGYLPTDPTVLSEEAAKRGLRVSGGGVFGSLHKAETWESDVNDARKVAALVQAMGAKYVIYLPQLYRDLDGNYTDTTTLNGEQWGRLLNQMNIMGRLLNEEFGVDLVFHPHADSHVGTEEEVYRFLDGTDPRYVSLCLDTGHIAYCGGDNVAIVERNPERIGYVHLKQVDPDILATINEKGLSFAQGVRMGAMCEPPKGVPEMPPLLDALGKLDKDLYAIVEQDLYPCPTDVPFPIALRTRNYFGSCGVGPIPGQR